MRWNAMIEAVVGDLRPRSIAVVKSLQRAPPRRLHPVAVGVTEARARAGAFPFTRVCSRVPRPPPLGARSAPVVAVTGMGVVKALLLLSGQTTESSSFLRKDTVRLFSQSTSMHQFLLKMQNE